MNAAALLRLLLAATPLLAAGCARTSAGLQASAADRAACRQRSEQVYIMQHRDEMMRADQYATSGRDAPFGGAGAAGASPGLAGLFAHRQMVSDCLNGRAGNVGTSPAAPILE